MGEQMVSRQVGSGHMALSEPDACRIARRGTIIRRWWWRGPRRSFWSGRWCRFYRLSRDQWCGRWLAIVAGQLRLFGVARRVEVLDPLGVRKPHQLLAPDGAKGQAGIAAQALQCRDVLIADHSAFGVRHTACREQVAQAAAGRAVAAGVDGHRVPVGNLPQFVGQRSIGSRRACRGGNAARWLGCSLGGGAVRKGHLAIRSNDAIDRLRLSTYRCQGQQQGGSCSRSERKTGHVGSPHSCGLCLLWGSLRFVQYELQAVSSSAIPWWRSRASRLGSRPRKALKDSMAGRLPPASRMASR